MFNKLCTTDYLLSAWKSVKAKNSAGGIDGFTVLSFEDKLEDNILHLLDDLKSGKWNPEPYLRIEIPKNESEKRRLGLLSVKDKIAQQAIKQLIEPHFERIFLGNSYGYRPGKGHVRAVKRTMHEFSKLKNGWVAKLDIDNYFDNINHELLFSKLRQIISDPEILRLIELSVKMGVVTKRLKWHDTVAGVPQGAVLSPLLANFYLHSFDKFVTGKTEAYIRYADDFLMLAPEKKDIDNIVSEASEFLRNKLLLNLNAPTVNKVTAGISFLGIMLYENRTDITNSKKEKLLDKIRGIEIKSGGFTKGSLEALQGIKIYYATLLSQELLRPLDECLNNKVMLLIQANCMEIPNAKQLQHNLRLLPAFSNEAELTRNKDIKQWTAYYQEQKKKEKGNKLSKDEKNTLLINRKKREYRKQENDGSELVISSYGSFIGKNNKGITVKINGKNVKNNPSNMLEHITVVTRGISISSDAIHYCMSQKIPIDFFDGSGKLYASILSPVFIEQSLWQKQATLTTEQKSYLASRIIEGKLRNQLNLIKYFNKYHKEEGRLNQQYEKTKNDLEIIIKKTKNTIQFGEKYAEQLIAYEATGAVAYWAYIRLLFEDDDIEFESRERKGATDIVNSLLNYGYSLLYARVWQAVLSVKLNPTLSILHAQQPGKPTFIYDIIELFRAQAVDRVVISLVQKGEPLTQDKAMLSEPTKKLLIQNILERMNRYEKYRGEEMKFLRILREQSREIAEYISGESNSFKPYIAKW